MWRWTIKDVKYPHDVQISGNRNTAKVCLFVCLLFNDASTLMGH